jgi:F-box protein 28
MCLGESSEDEITITRIMSTPAHNESEDNGPMILQNTEDIITHLPEELLEYIMLKLNYDEISNVRQVCRRFRDTANNILNRQFRSVERLLADLVKEENALLPKTSTPTYRLILIRCRGTLNEICDQIRLLRAVSYRLLFLGDVQPNIHYSSVFFAGNIIDEVHRILRIVKTGRLPTEGVDLAAFRDLVHTWIMFFTHTIEPRLIQQICALNQSTCPDLYGSKVTDLLECLLNSKKFFSVNIDSEGWCYIKGEYKLRRSFFKCEAVSNSELKPLTVPEQINFHEALYYLVKINNENRLMEAQTEEENAIRESGLTKYVSGSYKGLSVFAESCYFHGQYSKHAFWPTLRKGNGASEDGTETSVYTVQDSNPDLRLKLEIEHRPAEGDNI